MLTETQQKIIELLQSGDQANIDMVLNWSEEVTGFDHIEWITNTFGFLVMISIYDFEKYSFSVNLAKLFSSKTLDISGYQLTKVPEAVKYLTHLESLWMTKNKIHTLPDWIYKLKNLKIICLERNPINELPESMGELVNLSEIYLEHTQISELPTFFENFINLDTLWINDTPIKNIPDYFKKFKVLKSFKCFNTPITPEDIVNWRKILSCNIIF